MLSTILILGVNNLIDANSQADKSTNQSTVPTRTPTGLPTTPKPPGATSTPQSSSPVPTEVPSSPTVELVLTPEGGYYPTAVPCTEPPTVQAFDTVNIRSGPSTEYELIGQLVFLEVRPIIGRSQFVTWWLIELEDNATGWVIDEAVTVSGYIGNVPIVAADPAGEQTPDPQSTWAPTVEPQCTPLPTHTLTPPATNTPIKETVAGPEITLTATESPAIEEVDETPTKEQVSPTPRSTEAPLTPSPEATETINVSQNLAEDSYPVSDTGDEGFNFNILLYIGFGLIFVGVILYIGRRIIS